MARLPAAALLVVAACYHPADEATCTVSCASAACPGNMQCGADLLCHPQNGPDCGPSVVDAAVVSYSGNLGVMIQVPADLPMSVSIKPMIDTNTLLPGNCTSIQGSMCVIAAQTISIDNPTSATGQNSLVLFATQSIVVSAPLDVSSKRPTAATGPAFGGPNCATTLDGGGTVVATSAGAGGGAGGSFQGVGGAGGVGANASGTPATNGGKAANAALATSLRGGCSGGSGGGAGGAGGPGGGAIYLFSLGTISVAASGSIDASGAGGSAVNMAAATGGGGGGAGGMIVLDGQPVTIDPAAVLIASGGGGGGGGPPTSSIPTGGDDPLTTSPAIGASGGTSPGGGKGGQGSSRASLNATAGHAGTGVLSAATGGGGGGGGAGYILFFPAGTAPVGNLNISPAPE